jgi:hypothetical protein
MDWNGLEWIGMDWNGLEWIGMDWNGLEWIGMDWNGVEWSGMEWTNGVEWIGMESTVSEAVSFKGSSNSKGRRMLRRGGGNIIFGRMVRRRL